jgi:hypothetical protein
MKSTAMVQNIIKICSQQFYAKAGAGFRLFAASFSFISRCIFGSSPFISRFILVRFPFAPRPFLVYLPFISRSVYSQFSITSRLIYTQFSFISRSIRTHLSSAPRFSFLPFASRPPPGGNYAATNNELLNYKLINS